MQNVYFRLTCVAKNIFALYLKASYQDQLTRLFPQANHSDCLSHRDVTRDVLSHTFAVFHNARSRFD